MIGLKFDRKISMQFLLFLVFCACLIFLSTINPFLLGSEVISRRHFRVTACCSYYLIKFLIAAFWVVSFLYFIEVFPTVVRVSGPAFCVAVGRLGSIFAPVVYEGLQYMTKDYKVCFFFVKFVCFWVLFNRWVY